MAEVIVDVSTSVDGFVAGAGVSVERPFGTAGHRLHRWLGLEEATPGPEDRAAAERMFASAGAVVLGRRMFDVGIATWGDEGAFARPAFVVTRRDRETLVKGPTTFTFVTDGLSAALGRARAAAGAEDVVIVGGADIVQQSLAAGAVDELRLHVTAVLLGAGTRLFSSAGPVELEQTGASATPNATHLTFRTRRQETNR